MLLSNNWTVKGTDHCGHDFDIPATVPGCLHTDLQKAGILPDLFWRDNNEQAQWVENCDVTYTCRFTLDKVEENTVFNFRGLDVYCTVICNGVTLGQADNMHTPWVFSAENSLKVGENILQVCFRSPVKEVQGLPPLPAAFTYERLYTRRIQCSYGWDWVGRFVTMGIWREVSLEKRICDMLPFGNDGIYIYTKDINPFSAQIHIQLEYPQISGNAYAEMSIFSPDCKKLWSKRRRVLENKIEEDVDIVNPELWYPSGYGEQPLYTFTCRTFTEDMDFIDSERKNVNFGIRKLTIIEPIDPPDSEQAKLSAKLKAYEQLVEWDKNEISSAFIVLVNGVRIFCQGANWVPCEPFPSAETPEKIKRLVKSAKDCGVNMLRVWGGGIFENDAFYSACDAAGILVTQDFLMACGHYPENDEKFKAHLIREADAGARALRNHTCLAWWSGDNENAVNGDENMPEYPGRISALKCIAPVLEKLDSQRRFLPSSPYGGVPYASAVRGTTHHTQYLGNFFSWIRKGDFTKYQDYFHQYLCRFTAEQPAIGLPFVSSLEKFMTDEDIFGDDTSISEYHTKNNPGLGDTTLYGYVDRLTKGIFGEYTDGHDRIKKMQCLQAEWIRLSMELFRRHQWYSSGIIYWMFNDCWPAANGWSLVDYYCNPKPSFYAFRRATKPVICSIMAQDETDCDKIRIIISANGQNKASGKGRLYRYNILSGDEDCINEFEFCDIFGESRTVLETEAIELDNKTVLLCDIESDLGNDRAFYLPYRYADMAFEPKTEPSICGVNDTGIVIKADATLPWAFIDDLGCVLSDNGMFMKIGEEKFLRFE